MGLGVSPAAFHMDKLGAGFRVYIGLWVPLRCVSGCIRDVLCRSLTVLSFKTINPETLNPKPLNPKPLTPKP